MESHEKRLDGWYHTTGLDRRRNRTGGACRYQAQTWRGASMPMLAGLAVALLELTLMGYLRYALTGTMGWPVAL